MTEVVPATDTIIDESIDPSQKVEKQTKQYSIFSRVEVNFEKFSIWSTKPKRGTAFAESKVIEYDPERLPDGNAVRRKIEIVPSAKYGYPTTQTQVYWYALQKLWHESPNKEKGIVEFSRRQILVDVLGQSYSKKSRRALDLSINQLSSTQLELDYLFYDKAKNETYRELNKFSLLTGIRLTQRKRVDEVIHEKCSVTFHPLITSNLLCGYYKPILSVVSEIDSEIGRLLYSKLDLQFSHYTKYEISTARFFRENGLVGGEYHQPGRRKRALEKAIKELIGKPTSSGAVIAKYEFARTADGKDWKLIVRSKGKRDRNVQVEVLDSLKISEQPEQKQQESSQKTPQKPQESRQKPEKAQAKETPTPPQEKPLQGDSGLHGVAEIFDSMPSAPDSEALNSEALELLKYFDSVFDLSSDLNRNDVPKAELFVERYSLAAGKFLVDFAHQQGSKPGRFSDILPYRAEALEAFNRKPQEPQKSEAKVIPINAAPDDLDLKAIHHFHQKFGGRIQASGKVRSKVKELIDEHGLDFAIFLVDFARKKISDSHSNYQPKTFSGILNSQSEALEEWEAKENSEKLKKKQDDEYWRKKLEEDRDEYKRIHQKRYWKFIIDSLEMQGEYLDKFSQFRVWENEKRSEILENAKNQPPPKRAI